MKRFCSIILVIALLCCASSVTATAQTETAKKYIAFTFDDGPNNTTCIDVLDVLKKYDVPATFFTIGSRCNDGTKAALQRMKDQGCEIGMHGFDHQYMGSWTIEEINADLQKCSDAVNNLCGVRPALFRLPFLNMPEKATALQIQYPLIAGGGPADYNGSAVETRVNGLLDAARDGQIFLCHCMEGNQNTVDAIDTVIPKLIEQGYTIVTVSELFKLQGVAPTLGYQWYRVPKAEDITLPENAYGIYEAEKTKTHSNTGTERTNQNDIAPFGEKYISSNCGVGQVMEFTLPAVAAGEYSLVAYSRNDSNRATAEIIINDTTSIGQINMYAKSAEYKAYKTNENGENLIITVSADSDVKITFKAITAGTIAFDKFVLVPTTEQTAIPGDVNSDGDVNTKDVLVVRKHLAGMQVEIKPQAADVNFDGDINTKDLLLIRKFLAGIIIDFTKKII